MTLEVLFSLSDVGCFFLNIVQVLDLLEKGAISAMKASSTASPARIVFSAYRETQGDRCREDLILLYPGRYLQ